MTSIPTAHSSRAPKGCVAVLGAGAWGTALALALLRAGSRVNLWVPEPEHYREMSGTRFNDRYLPGVHLDASIRLYSDLESALEDTVLWLMVVPSQAVREVASNIQALRPDARVPLCVASKGLDASLRFLHEVLFEIFGENYPLGFLSGPSFAAEVAAMKPTAVHLAATDLGVAETMASFFRPALVFQLGSDLLGTQLAATYKNILAIAVGLCDGLGLGTNTRSAVLTFGMQELLKMGQALGAQAETLTGLAGFGDIVLTCLDDQSRNRRFGLEWGRRYALPAASSGGHVVEGYHNVQLLERYAKQHHLETPVLSTLAGLMRGELDLSEWVPRLFG